MLLAIRQTTQFKPTRPDYKSGMSRQSKFAQSLMNDQGQLRPAPRIAVRPSGYVISLSDLDSQHLQTCVHVKDYKDELVVHIRKFKNGIPTVNGIAYNHNGWKCLDKLIPTLDNYVRGADNHGVQKALFAFDSEKSVMVLNGGSKNVQVVFQREDKHIVLTYDQWTGLVEKRDYIKMKIIEHMGSLITRLEAVD